MILLIFKRGIYPRHAPLVPTEHLETQFSFRQMDVTKRMQDKNTV